MTEQDEHETRVVYRRYPNGEIVAVFPDQRTERGLVGSFMHVGQHGNCAPGIIVRQTRPAPDDDPAVAELEQELVGRGYRLRRVRRM